MKKSITIIALALASIALPASAQYHGHYPRAYLEGAPRATRTHFGPSDTYYGFRIGITGAKVNSDDARLDGGSMQRGLNAGAVAGFRLGAFAPIYFETGLNYTEKGGKGSYGGSKFTYDLDYLEVPLVLKYRVPLAPDVTIDPFFGGYLALGVGGKIKNYGEREAYSSFSENNFNRFDGGLRLGIGAQLSLLYLEIGYDHGLSNICGDWFDESHTRTIFANVGINF